jgi:hypothetical protein
MTQTAVPLGPRLGVTFRELFPAPHLRGARELRRFARLYASYLRDGGAGALREESRNEAIDGMH